MGTLVVRRKSSPPRGLRLLQTPLITSLTLREFSAPFSITASRFCPVSRITWLIGKPLVCGDGFSSRPGRVSRARTRSTLRSERSCVWKTVWSRPDPERRGKPADLTVWTPKVEGVIAAVPAVGLGLACWSRSSATRCTYRPSHSVRRCIRPLPSERSPPPRRIAFMPFFVFLLAGAGVLLSRLPDDTIDRPCSFLDPHDAPARWGATGIAATLPPAKTSSWSPSSPPARAIEPAPGPAPLLLRPGPVSSNLSRQRARDRSGWRPAHGTPRHGLRADWSSPLRAHPDRGPRGSHPGPRGSPPGRRGRSAVCRKHAHRRGRPFATPPFDGTAAERGPTNRDHLPVTMDCPQNKLPLSDPSRSNSPQVFGGQSTRGRPHRAPERTPGLIQQPLSNIVPRHEFRS